MRKTLCGVLLAALSATGCVISPFQADTNTTPPTEPLVSRPARPRPPAVRPEQVHEDNADKIAEALERELKAEAEPEVTPPPPPVKK